jgi:Tfp pilus assembly protein PilN
MIQQINLYQAPFRGNQQRLSAKTLLQGAAAFVSILLMMAALHGWQIIRLQHQVTFLENQYSFLNTEYSDLEHKLTAAHADTVLAEQVKKMEDKLNSQQQLQSLLNDDLFNSGQGYSRYLIALARQHIAGLWLTSIILNGAGHDIALQGQATRADLLPRYLQNLSHESLLQGLELQIFHLSRNTDKSKSRYTGTFGFMVATTDTEGSKP